MKELNIYFDCENGYSLNTREAKAAIRKVIGKVQISVRPQDLQNLITETVQDYLNE